MVPARANNEANTAWSSPAGFAAGFGGGSVGGAMIFGAGGGITGALFAGGARDSILMSLSESLSELFPRFGGGCLAGIFGSIVLSLSELPFL